VSERSGNLKMLAEAGVFSGKPATSRTPTAEEMNRAVALVLGWRKCNERVFQSNELWHLKGRGFALERDLPNYHGSLDACAEMRKSLTREQQDQFANELYSLLPCDENHGPAMEGGEDIMTPSLFQMVHAAAELQTEAFLRLHGKWEGLCK
jgi:hypothetical protein